MPHFVVVLASCGSSSGKERSIQCSAEPFGCSAGLVKWCPKRFDAPAKRAGGPQRRSGGLGVAQLAHDPPNRVGSRIARIGNPGWVGEQFLDLAQQHQRHPHAASQNVAEHVLAGGICATRLLAVNAGLNWLGLWCVSLEVKELQRQLHPTLAVGNGVVQFLDERRLATTQPVDHHELPEWPGAIEGIAGDQAGQVEQLTQGSRLRKGDVAYVVPQIKVAVVNPHWCSQIGRCRLHSLPEARDNMNRSVHSAKQLIKIGWTVEHRDVCERAG